MAQPSRFLTDFDQQMGYNEVETHMLSHQYKVSDEKRK